MTDPAGAVVAGAKVDAKNAQTGVVYSAATTNAGTYSIPDLPVGNYTVTATVTGFKTYTHSNIALPATQIVREDISLQVGNATESVTVTAEASLLQTESGELSTNVNIDQLDQLPLLGIGTVNAGTSGYRNPYNTLLTLPGVSTYASSGQFAINGLGGNSNGNVTEAMRIEGQDATSRIFGTYNYTQMAQPGADSIQEIAYQTSNYAAEYGTAGSVVINMTMKSGTNAYHGSVYDYFVNEVLNAGDPFSVNANGVGKVRPTNSRNDFGGTLGGPISIPKLYSGKNRSFFFFSYEEFLESTLYSDSDTVPTPAYLQGDFSAISPNGTCGACNALGIQTTGLGIPNPTVDALGRPLYANEIYDPTTRAFTAGGLGYATPFLGNKIPPAAFDRVSQKIMALFPAAQNANFNNNYTGTITGNRYSVIPSIKIDQNLSSKDKLSFYYSENNTESQISGPLGNQDGLPQEIGGYRGTFIPTYTERLNFDRTITPTLLLHLGGGYLHTSFSDRAPFLKFDPSQFDLSGFEIHRQFPSVTGMCSTSFFTTGCANATGGMQNIGTAGQIQSLNYEEKPSFNANITWVRGKHTYKAGAELYLEQGYTGSFAGVTLATGNGPTIQPFQPGVSLGGYTQGFGFASFLLGDYTESTQSPQENTRLGMQQWALFLQDSWKVTRKLTLDYGLRWDLATPQREQYGRLGQLDTVAANANAGGHPGATQYADTCHCNFYPGSYPFAIGPRIGVAYQVDPKTVLRAGWGFVYQFVGNAAGQTIGTPGIYPLAPQPGGAQFVNDLTPGFILQPTWPVRDPNIYPSVPGTLGQPGGFFTAGTDPYVPDPQQNRPPRINQFSVSVQREVTRNFIVEAAYVANRGAWIQGPFGFMSQLSAKDYARYGLYPYPGTGPKGYNSFFPDLFCVAGNDCDRALLQQPINSSDVIQAMSTRGITNLLPYAGFPTSAPLQDIIYPYPQFPGLEPAVSPTGFSRYDSLQMKATKRLSHNLVAGGTFTWAKGFTSPAAPQDFFNHAAETQDVQQIPPLTLNFNFVYTTPKSEHLNKWVNMILKDWQLGGFANYQSGAFLAPPNSQTAAFLPSNDVRVSGQPLYNKGINPNNLATYNPYYDQVLNPNAWTACPVNQTCASQGVLYTDFRAPRTPLENANIGRNFRINERWNIFVRAEFVNIFNRTLMPPPTTNGFFGVDPAIPPARLPNGVIVGGFGTIGVYNPPGAYYAAPSQATSPYLSPRTGTLIMRLTF